MQYFKDHSAQYNNVEFKFGSLDITKKVIEELRDMEIMTLEDLDKIFTDKFRKEIIKVSTLVSLSGIIRYALMIYNYEKYFKNAWKKN